MPLIMPSPSLSLNWCIGQILFIHKRSIPRKKIKITRFTWKILTTHRIKSSEVLPLPCKKKIRDYIEKQLDNLLLNEDLTINFSAISDFIIHHFFRDLEIYYASRKSNGDRSSYLAREAIREKLAQILRKHRKKEILIMIIT